MRCVQLYIDLLSVAASSSVGPEPVLHVKHGAAAGVGIRPIVAWTQTPVLGSGAPIGSETDNRASMFHVKHGRTHFVTSRSAGQFQDE